MFVWWREERHRGGRLTGSYGQDPPTHTGKGKSQKRRVHQFPRAAGTKYYKLGAITQTDPHTVLKARIPKSRCYQGCAALETLDGISPCLSPASGGDSESLTSLGCSCNVIVSALSLNSMFLSVSSCGHPLRTSVIGFRACANPVWPYPNPIASAAPLFPGKVMITGVWLRISMYFFLRTPHPTPAWK